MTVIEPDRTAGAWKVVELRALSVLQQKDQAIGYAETHAYFGAGEIRVSDSTGKLERTIALTNRVESCELPREH